MPVSLASLGIEQLSIAERLVLVEDLWDSIAAQSPVSEAQGAELSRRFADHAANPDDVMAWEDVQTSINTRLQQ